jgi:type II secretory pathway pseudopilin PulG
MRSSERGFTYLSLLIVVALLGGGLAAFGEYHSHAAQREKEADLLFVGGEFRRAISQYYESSPGGHLRYPARLDDLLKDQRFAFNRRYLRKLYADPMTGKPDWGLVESPEGGIMGVYSLSKEDPVKTGNFAFEDRAFEKARGYKDWQFVHQRPPSPPGPSAAR